MSEGNQTPAKAADSTTQAGSGNSKLKNRALKSWSLAVDGSRKDLQGHFKKATPLIIKLVDFFEVVVPIVEKFYVKFLDVWKSLQPHRPQLVFPMFVGLVLCFFGGSFVTLIAAAEAWKMCGHESTTQYFNMLFEDMAKVEDESAKDDTVDSTGDGIPDVLEESSAELVVRKALLFFEVVDPNRIANCIGGICAGVMAMFAAIEMKV